MSETVEELKEYPLSNDDINRVLGGTNIYAYPELAQFSSLDDALDERGRMVLLYLTEDANTGHWVCVWRDGKTIRYHDPYGNPPEHPKRWLSPMRNQNLGQAPNYLLRLFKGAGSPVYYNTHPYQRQGADINTCGRHAITRLLLKDVSDKQYYDIVKDSDVNPDDFVSIATYFLLGK
jgi:hypothetical protein